MRKCRLAKIEKKQNQDRIMERFVNQKVTFELLVLMLIRKVI